MKLPYSKSIFRILIVLLLSLPSWFTEAVEIKWTPGEEKAPEYSLQDRQKLLRLDQEISSSPNPQAALAQVAQSGGLEPNQLAEILMENRRFFQEHGGRVMAGGRKPLTVVMAKAVTSMFVMLWHASLKYPRISMTMLISLLLASWVAWNAPRNGVLIGGSGSARPTTLFAPPTKFLEATMLEPEWWVNEDVRLSPIQVDSKDFWRQIDAARRKQRKNANKADQVEWYSDFTYTKRSRTVLAKAATMERVADMESIFPRLEESEDEQEEGKNGLYQKILEDQAERLLIIRPQLTEFLSPHKVKFSCPTKDEDDDEESSDVEFGLLMVPGLGKWGAIGYIPFILQSYYGDDNDDDQKRSVSDDRVLASLVLSPLPGSYWVGQDIFIRILQTPGQSNAVVQVALAVNADLKSKRKGKLSKKLVNRIIESLCTSLQSSLETRTRQAIARQGQSARFASRAKLSALERRRKRASLERQMEEMAADRRRRRFKENPDQGRYRPSGERMRSPNNAIYK